MRKQSRIGSGLLAIAASLALGASLAAPANATTINSWIGPLSADGINYLHYSTIADTPALAASARIYTVDGNPVPPGQIGARGRLFKSGALCKATNYVYNGTLTPTITATTSGDCGSGSYNSHGFVQAWNGSNYTEIFTFPTNPLNYTASTALQTPSAAARESGTTSSGKTFGSAEGIRDEKQLPDLVAAYATNGKFGYISSDALAQGSATSPADAAKKRPTARTIPVIDKTGTTVGTFQVS